MSAKAYFVLMIYNEADSVRSVIESIATADLPAHYERRVVAINDGSIDGTDKVLEEAAKEYPVDIVSFPERRGMPKSFVGMFEFFEPILKDDDLVFTLEADNTNDITCVPALTKCIEDGADVAIASRYAPGAASIGFPAHRLWGSAVINQFLGILWGVPKVRDYSVLYRVYRGKALKDYIATKPQLRARKSFAVISEILMQMSLLTSRFAEVPLRYDYSLKKGPSKMKLTQTLIEYTRITPLSMVGHRLLRLFS